MKTLNPLRIVMFTNTFTPHVGGVARSVESFCHEFRQRGHQVKVVAPEFPGQEANETHVIRVPAIQNFNGGDFSVVISTPDELLEELEAFDPQIVHSHHPFLLGNEAARFARLHELPLIATHHTLYERYTHYVPADSSLLKRFVIELGTSYANLCDHVIAPSESVANLIRSRGVESPVSVVPTGVNFDLFNRGNGPAFRSRHGIPEDAFVVGHIGRLAKEKNLAFLTDATIKFMLSHPDAWFVLVGDGPMRTEITARLQANDLHRRVVMLGSQGHDVLRHAYAAMDAFAFASHSETQGMVLTEAMAASAPVVAVDASGVREVLVDGHNGRLIKEDSVEDFVAAITWIADLAPEGRQRLREHATQTAKGLSIQRCADRALDIYQSALEEHQVHEEPLELWRLARNRIAAEWEIFSGSAMALGTAAADEIVEGELAAEPVP